MSAGKSRRGPVKELGRGGVQEYLKEQVELHGGAWDHFSSPGKKGVPDLIITWPMHGWAKIDFVETKTIGGKLESWQDRDHKRRAKLGCHVVVIWDFGGVDRYTKLRALTAIRAAVVNRRCGELGIT